MDFNSIKNYITMWNFFRLIILLFILSLLIICIVPLFGQKCNTTNDILKYDIIIVLGNPANDSCRPSPIMRERVNKGVELFKNGLAKKILFTGSSVGNKCNESVVMKEYAIIMGIPDSAIIIESRAKNTYQNALYSTLYMKKNNLSVAAIVTSKFHLKRAFNIFANYNIKYNMFPCDNPNDLSQLEFFIWDLREKAILTYHTIFGYSKKFGLNTRN